MDYIRTEVDGQLAITQSSEFLLFPSCLYGFQSLFQAINSEDHRRQRPRSPGVPSMCATESLMFPRKTAPAPAGAG